MRAMRAVGCLLLCVLLATACSSSDGATNAEPPPFDAVLIKLFGTTDTEAYLVTAERRAAELVVVCMNEAGFEFAIPPAPVGEDALDPANVDQARATGFGIIDRFRKQVADLDPDAMSDQDKNLAYLSTLSSGEIERFFLTLDGEPAEPGQRQENAGCNGEASDVAYADWLRFFERLPNYTALGEERDTHPDWLAARAEWGECMADRGFDYAEPDAIQSDVLARMRASVDELYPGRQVPLVQDANGDNMLDPEVDRLLEELAQFERDAAVANAECAAPIADQFDAVEQEVQQGFVDRNRADIDELLRLTG